MLKPNHNPLGRPDPEKPDAVMDDAGVIEQIQAAGLRPPESLTLMVTRGCNLHCRHCWLDCVPPGNAAPPGAADLSGVIDSFTLLGGRHITLTGGEFLTHPEWCRLLAFCLDHPRLESVRIQTNATLIDRRFLEALNSLGIGKLTIQISLDGACARTHDLVRGTGSFALATAGLRRLVAMGLGPRVHIAFTEMMHNFYDLPRLLENTDKMAIGHLTSSTLVSGGRAAASNRISLPTPAQYWELIHLYQTDADFRDICDRKATIAAIEWFKHRSGPGDGGCSCIENLFIDSRGCMYPCTMLLMQRYASESIYRLPMDRTLRKALDQWREIPILSRQRRQGLKSCVQCAGKNHCGGGCMGRAAIPRGELMDPEDRCALRKAVYHWAPCPGIASLCHRD